MLTSEPRAKLLQNAFNDGSRLAVLKSIVKPSALKTLGVKIGKKSGVWSKSSEKPCARKFSQLPDKTIQREKGGGPEQFLRPTFGMCSLVSLGCLVVSLCSHRALKEAYKALKGLSKAC